MQGGWWYLYLHLLLLSIKYYCINRCSKICVTVSLSFSHAFLCLSVSPRRLLAGRTPSSGQHWNYTHVFFFYPHADSSPLTLDTVFGRWTRVTTFSMEKPRCIYALAETCWITLHNSWERKLPQRPLRHLEKNKSKIEIVKKIPCHTCAHFWIYIFFLFNNIFWYIEDRIVYYLVFCYFTLIWPCTFTESTDENANTFLHI